MCFNALFNENKLYLENLLRPHDIIGCRQMSKSSRADCYVFRCSCSFCSAPSNYLSMWMTLRAARETETPRNLSFSDIIQYNRVKMVGVLLACLSERERDT